MTVSRGESTASVVRAQIAARTAPRTARFCRTGTNRKTDPPITRLTRQLNAFGMASGVQNGPARTQTPLQIEGFSSPGVAPGVAPFEHASLYSVSRDTELLPIGVARMQQLCLRLLPRKGGLTVVPLLVHFPDGDPRVVMHVSEVQLVPGDELLSGWFITRNDPVDWDRPDGCECEVWVAPLAA